MNATITPEAAGPLVEFISEGIAVLESDLLMISANAIEAVEEINAFKEKYPFAFQQSVAEQEQQPVEYSAPEPEAAPGEEQVLTPEGQWVPRSQVEEGYSQPARAARFALGPTRPGTRGMLAHSRIFRRAWVRTSRHTLCRRRSNPTMGTILGG